MPNILLTPARWTDGYGYTPPATWNGASYVITPYGTPGGVSYGDPQLMFATAQAGDYVAFTFDNLAALGALAIYGVMVVNIPVYTFTVLVNGTIIDAISLSTIGSTTWTSPNFNQGDVISFAAQEVLHGTNSTIYYTLDMTLTPTPAPAPLVPPLLTFNPGLTKVFKGLGQTFTNLIRFNKIDTGVSPEVTAYRGWDIKLVHRLGALVRPDSLQAQVSSGVVPSTGYSVALKRTERVNSTWISGLRVQLVQIGSRKLNGGQLLVPTGTADDWIFRIEVYNPTNPTIDYYTYDTTQTFTDFNALDGTSTSLNWKHFTVRTGIVTTTMPIQITGLQNVLNIIFGYSDLLVDRGFSFSSQDTPLIDSSTGRSISWQLEVEKLIDVIYSGLPAGSAYILNPFMDKLYFQTPVGLLGRYTDSRFIDPATAQSCYDVLGTPIKLKQLNVVRTDNQAITYSKVPIFSAHLYTDEFEHAVLFNTRYSDDPTSATLFDQFLGISTASAYLSFNRQRVTSGKPLLDGFFLSGDNVVRNISSSVDTIKDAYDSNLVFNEPTMAPHSLALIGFQEKDYFSNINISPATQLDFWKGMIQAKGTNLTIDAFTNYKQFTSSTVDEFWAYKLATYGDARERTLPEIKISPNDVTRGFTQLQFYSVADTIYAPLPLFIQIEAQDDTRWFSIDDLGTVLRFDATSISETVEMVAGVFPVYVRTKNIYYTGDSLGPTVTPTGATMLGANILKVTSPGTYTISGFTWINKTKLSPIKLFDYSEDVLDVDIGLWHPAIGIHAPEPLELVNITSATDPARYNYTTQVDNNSNYAALKPWGEREVGRVWWDTSNLAYIPYHDASIFPNRESRNSRWGKLAEWASIDLYQWTKSPFHPSLYDAQATAQEGNSAIDASVRLSGQVGFTQYYSRPRTIFIAPIAWSLTSSANGLAHPAFGSPTFTKTWISGTSLIIDSGRLVDAGLTSGRRYGPWDMLNFLPTGEAIIGATIGYDIGSSVQPGDPVIIPGILTGLTISQISGASIFGTRIGQLELVNYFDGVNYNLRLKDPTGFYQDVVVADWTSTNAAVDNVRTYAFSQFGLQLTAIIASTGTLTALQLVTAMSNVNNDIYVREFVNITPVVPFNDIVCSNNPLDGYEHGWKAWDVPTQAQLAGDLTPPLNAWLPYIGVKQRVLPTAAVIADVTASTSNFILSSGITVSRYSSTWGNWVELTPTILEQISNGVTVGSFTLTNETAIDVTRLSVYINGIQLAPSSITVSGVLISLNTVQPEGATLTLLYRAYTPTKSDLAFDPTISDNYTIQTQYKLDYQYTQVTNRDSTGAILGTDYYFWVTNKTVVTPGQSSSLQAAAANLEGGDLVYTIFSRLVTDPLAKSGVAFDSCAISGLNSYVSKNNAYKLRFLRDFTLRDDPEELKLKNVHTEWALIRQHQTSKIPSSLWAALINAAAGQDANGDSLPSFSRISYDNKYGTNTRFGFGQGQIFADSVLVLTSIINTILNTSLIINLGQVESIDYITFLGITSSTTPATLRAEWFSSPAQVRATMNSIYLQARAAQVNEIFFSTLSDALANNYEFTDLFKTSMITINSSTAVAPAVSNGESNDFY